jgi:hypothetical protein
LKRALVMRVVSALVLSALLAACGGGGGGGVEAPAEDNAAGSRAQALSVPPPWRPRVPDTTPDPITIAEVRDVTPASWVTSAELVVSGINTATPLAVSGGEVSVNDGPYSAAPATVRNLDRLRVRLFTAAGEKAATRADIVVGGVGARFVAINTGRRFGLNFNGAIDAVVGGERVAVDALQSQWIRAFYDYFFFANDPSYPNRLNNSPRISNLVAMKQAGYQTVVSIKWGFKEAGLTAMPVVGSTEMNTYKARLTALYDRLWPHADIIVVGNEPFIDSPGAAPSRNAQLLGFYTEMLNHTVNYRTNHATRSSTPIYLGAFNRLAETGWQTASASLLALASSRAEVAGVDLHIHHLDDTFVEMRNSIQHAASRIRADQKIIATEFSAMRYWKTHNANLLDPGFAVRHSLNPAWQVYQYLDHTLALQAQGQGVTREQWLDFVGSHPWYDGLQQRYLADAYQTFVTHAPQQFLLATYGARQQFGAADRFDLGDDPWILNGLLLSRTVALLPDGRPQLNKSYHLDFDRLR